MIEYQEPDAAVEKAKQIILAKLQEQYNLSLEAAKKFL